MLLDQSKSLGRNKPKLQAGQKCNLDETLSKLIPPLTVWIRTTPLEVVKIDVGLLW
jgi:hypothetical protein